MVTKAPRAGSHIRGAARLAIDATTGLTDLVEAMQERIQRPPGVPPPDQQGRTDGITGLVYKSVRGVTRLVGASVDTLLALLEPVLVSAESVVEREALLAALNGVVGDHLVSTSNSLATPMEFRREGQALALETTALSARLPDASGKLLIMLHGLCMNDLQWKRGETDFGKDLARDLGFTPVYLRYNSGLHVSQNGRTLAELLEQLLGQWPHSLDQVVLLGHSMGGLLARSAVYHGRLAGHRWTEQLTGMVFLGTPHHGAPLERAGHLFERVLGATPYAAPLARLGRVRSAGITDLRYGNLLDEDWMGCDRFSASHDRRRHVPLPEHVNCYAIAGTLGKQAGELKERMLGDGLVPLESALGHHRDPARCLDFPATNQWIGNGIHHMELLHHPEVYARLRQWLSIARA